MFKSAIDNCTYPFYKKKNLESSLKYRPENTIALTLCPKFVMLKLKYSNKIPKIFSSKCINRTCTEWGVNIYFRESCNLWKTCEEINCIMWEEAAYSRVTIQLELVEQLVAINVIYDNFLETLFEARTNMVHGK